MNRCPICRVDAEALSASRAEVVGLREALDPRAIGEAIVAASSAATETIAIDSEVLVFADATVVIDLVKLAAALAGEKPVGAGVETALASIPQGAIDALRNNQRQLDVDGCEVGVSRQAIDEVLAGIDAALSKSGEKP